MKYLFIILLLIPVYASCDTEELKSPLSCGQRQYSINYGIVLGFNKTNLNHTFQDVSIKTNFGYDLGFQYKYFIGYSAYPNSSILTRIVCFSNGIEYIVNNSVKDLEDLKITENNKQLQLSSYYLFKIISSGKISIHTIIGPYFNYFLNNMNSNNNILFNNKSFNKFEIGASIGIGFDFEFKDFIIGLEYKYMYAFTDKYNYQNDYIKNNSHLINFIFTPKLFGF